MRVFADKHQLLSVFSKLLRLTLENSRYNMVSLTNELKAIENYINLLNIDNADNPYSYKISLEKTIEVSNFMIPPMLIQPFIENAVETFF